MGGCGAGAGLLGRRDVLGTRRPRRCSRLSVLGERTGRLVGGGRSWEPPALGARVFGRRAEPRSRSGSRTARVGSAAPFRLQTGREFPSAISARSNSQMFKVNTASGVSSELLSSFILYSLSEQSPKGGYSIFFPTNLIAVHNLLAFAVYFPEVYVS